jgi:hypothetical protein
MTIQLPEAATMRAALAAAGFVQTGQRTGFYTRWAWTAATSRPIPELVVPENPEYPDFPDMMRGVLGTLAFVARQGAQAQAALDALDAVVPRLPANPADLAALVQQPTLAHLVLDKAFLGSAAALFSPETPATYRYALTRRWGGSPIAVFWMLNPSTADAFDDDPTIRRCVGFARREGCGGLVVVNVFAMRSADPALLATHADAVGPNNAQVVQTVLATAVAGGHPVIAAWGADTHLARSGHLTMIAKWVAEAGVDLKCLGVTKTGQPKHPARLHSNTPLVAYTFPKGQQS